MTEHTTTPNTPLFIADNLALDFLNSEFGTGSDRREHFVDDEAVLAWLKMAHALPAGAEKAPVGLMKLALELRDEAKALIGAANQGEKTDPRLINHLLNEGRAHQELRWSDAENAFIFTRQYRTDDPASLLEPIAQAIAELLTQTPLDLVRQCQAHDCTLMFHDKTKSHRRRWCSMAMCGNRMKVAAFRSRQKTE
jgi:predicted RNA-binding Zn ribbon-like protein